MQNLRLLWLNTIIKKSPHDKVSSIQMNHREAVAEEINKFRHLDVCNSYIWNWTSWLHLTDSWQSSGKPTQRECITFDSSVTVCEQEQHLLKLYTRQWPVMSPRRSFWSSINNEGVMQHFCGLKWHRVYPTQRNLLR